MAKPQYGHDHRKRRDALIGRWLGRPCPCPGCRSCGGACLNILTRRNAQFDHAVPVALGGTQATRFLCASCNTSRGATLGNRMRNRVILPRTPRSGSI